MEVWLSGLRRYIGNVVARLHGSVGSNPTTSSKIVNVPMRYQLRMAGYSMPGTPDVWLEEEITKWLDENADSVKDRGYNLSRKAYIVEFMDEETAIQFKLTFPDDE